MSTAPLDILALAAHRDDVEQTCGGTLLKMAQRGYRTGILDLTQGEMGTRGSAEDRAFQAVAGTLAQHQARRPRSAGQVVRHGVDEALDAGGRLERAQSPPFLPEPLARARPAP